MRFNMTSLDPTSCVPRKAFRTATEFFRDATDLAHWSRSARRRGDHFSIGKKEMQRSQATIVTLSDPVTVCGTGPTQEARSSPLIGTMISCLLEDTYHLVSFTSKGTLQPKFDSSLSSLRCLRAPDEMLPKHALSCLTSHGFLYSHDGQRLSVEFFRERHAFEQWNPLVTLVLFSQNYGAAVGCGKNEV